MVKSIEIKSANDVEKLNDFACSCPFDVYVDNQSIVLDARSLLGLMTLIGRKNTNLVFPDHADPKEIMKHLDKLNMD